MALVESKIPEFLTDRKNTTRQLIFTSVFALVFINLYSPFGVNTWQLTQLQLFFYSSLVILAGLLIIALSRIIMYLVTNYRQLSIGNYILWIAAEIVSLAIVYVLLQYYIISPPADLFSAFKESLKVTMLVLLLPYTISYLYLSWREKNKKLEQLSSSRESESNPVPLHMPFRDEKGELRFSLKSEDLLYLEAADNYVKIHYMDGKRIQNFMIRNSLKNLEKDLSTWGIIRCHRSYMVNFARVKIIRKEKDGLILEMDTEDGLSLPISETYVKEVIKAFSVD
ncbi:MAG: LytTR family DNA-binding domain-containing protein, partial [Bacteroidota bacterium]